MSIKVEEGYGESYLQGLPNNRLGNQYFDRRISYNTFPTRCPNDKKKTKQNLFQMRKKFVFMKDFTKVTEHKQPFTSVNQACHLYETATWIKYTSLF